MRLYSEIGKPSNELPTTLPLYLMLEANTGQLRFCRSQSPPYRSPSTCWKQVMRQPSRCRSGFNSSMHLPAYDDTPHCSSERRLASYRKSVLFPCQAAYAPSAQSLPRRFFFPADLPHITSQHCFHTLLYLYESIISLGKSFINTIILFILTM